MTYEEALEKINGRLAFGVKPGLERVTTLLRRLGDPQRNLKFVHVAGTNGKGTACTLTASVLKESGYITGLYTSPYVLEFRERFQINGEMIPKEELVREVELLSPLVDRLEAEGETVTEFEFITVLALHWFALRKCDVVVLETGLGGRLDATNVIDTPEVAVIMSISLDHTAVLGDTVQKIALEKAGIIKPGGRVVLYPQQQEGVREVFETVCRERGAELVIPDLAAMRVLEATIKGTTFQVGELCLRTPFLGEHQEKNAVTALAVIRLLKQRGFHISDEAVKNGFEKAFIPARMEIFCEKPLVLLDGGHNPGCAAALREVLSKFVPGKRVGIVGMVSDKDSMEALRIVGPMFSRLFTIAPNTPRALPAEKLLEIAREFCPESGVARSCEGALEKAFRALEEADALVVFGSFYLAAEIRDALAEKAKKLEKR